MRNGPAPVEDLYLEWLYSHIGAVRNRNPARSYWNLAKQLHVKPFIWFVPNDDNRVEDGRELRRLFLETTGYQLNDPYGLFMDLDCSMLEMLIALAHRCAFQTEEEPITWFWRFLHNIGLSRYTDDLYEVSIGEEVEEALERVIQRRYLPNGDGGLFPLRYPHSDQRNVELWYQKEAYLLEGAYVNVVPQM